MNKKKPLLDKKITVNAVDGAVRATFVKLLGKYNFRDEKQLIFFGKWLLFIVLIVMEVLFVLSQLDDFELRGGWPMLIRLLVLMGVLTISQALKLFVIKQMKNRIAFYVLDALIACFFVFFTSGTFPMLIYLLILTQFYLNFKSTKSSVTLFIISTSLYALFDIINNALLVDGPILWLSLVRETFGSVFVLAVHFIIVQVAWAFYRQFLKLDKALKELDESKKELEKAYEAVVEVTALEERQRIAKEIHDTAGHSMTTVIMQTEAAKLIIDNNPDEAKSKIVAANLQAKHALEELRNSVHLLSGTNEKETLKTALLGIIHESTDGTGIIIRSNIEEVKASPTKHRFICNTLKEGVSNALRHGGATAFWFELKEENGKICFLLSDNGKGANLDEFRVGFGLSTTMERAKTLGGEVKIETEEGEGFDLHLTLPSDKE